MNCWLELAVLILQLEPHSLMCYNVSSVTLVDADTGKCTTVTVGPSQREQSTY